MLSSSYWLGSTVWKGGIQGSREGLKKATSHKTRSRDVGPKEASLEAEDSVVGAFGAAAQAKLRREAGPASARHPKTVHHATKRVSGDRARVAGHKHEVVLGRDGSVHHKTSIVGFTTIPSRDPSFGDVVAAATLKHTTSGHSRPSTGGSGVQRLFFSDVELSRTRRKHLDDVDIRVLTVMDMMRLPHPVLKYVKRTCYRLNFALNERGAPKQVLIRIMHGKLVVRVPGPEWQPLREFFESDVIIRHVAAHTMHYLKAHGHLKRKLTKKGAGKKDPHYMASTPAFDAMVNADKKVELEEKARKAMSMWHHQHDTKKQAHARKKEKVIVAAHVVAAAHAAAAAHDVEVAAAAAAAEEEEEEAAEGDVDAVDPYTLPGRFANCCYDYPNEENDPDLCQLVAGAVVMVFGEADEEGWYAGSLVEGLHKGQKGLIASSYIEELSTEDVVNFKESMLPEDMVRFIALVDYEPVPALTDDGRSEDLPIKTGDIILVMPGSFSEDSFSVYGQCRGKLGNVLMNFVQPYDEDVHAAVEVVLKEGMTVTCLYSYHEDGDQEEKGSGGEHDDDDDDDDDDDEYGEEEGELTEEQQDGKQADLWFAAGDILKLLSNVNEDGFYEAMHITTGVTGLVPGNFIAPENHLETFEGPVAGEGLHVPVGANVNEGEGNPIRRTIFN